jgi:ABC-type multidrug transport system fused ATPase/permease subunit
LGHEGITDERVRWAAGEVHADRFIQRLREGYKTEVKERGAGLSVGQKQLISFARALAFDPALLILDEATSSIDTETEQLIQQAIERVMRDRTSIVVAPTASSSYTTAKSASKALTRNSSHSAASTGVSTNSSTPTTHATSETRRSR